MFIQIIINRHTLTPFFRQWLWIIGQAWTSFQETIPRVSISGYLRMHMFTVDYKKFYVCNVFVVDFIIFAYFTSNVNDFISNFDRRVHGPREYKDLPNGNRLTPTDIEFQPRRLVSRPMALSYYWSGSIFEDALTFVHDCISFTRALTFFVLLFIFNIHCIHIFVFFTTVFCWNKKNL